MHIKTRAYLETDKSRVTFILNSLWSDDDMMMSIYTLHKVWADTPELLRQTLVAAPVNQPSHIIGVGTIFESSLHPAMYMVAIHVDPKHQKKGIGSRIFEDLQTLGDGRPCLVKIRQKDIAGINFLKQHDFSIALRTLTGDIHPDDMTTKDWLTSEPTMLAGCSITELNTSDTTIEAYALMQAELYRQFHRWNPPIVEGVQQAINHYCHPERIIKNSNFCVLDGDRLIGAGNLIQNPFSETEAAYLVNLGISTAEITNLDKVRHLTKCLIYRLIESAAEKGIEITFEVDTVATPNFGLLQAIPAQNISDDFIIMTNA